MNNSDNNDNNDKNFINCQQKNNNNNENNANTQKDSNKQWKMQSSSVKIDGKPDENLINAIIHTNGCCIEKSDDETSEQNKNDDDILSNKSDDSTENLSFINENDLIDDIILLPDNIISDDEMSNPDNCVYAYRGSVSESPDMLLRNHNQQDQDDETDFLEMDFDPEPNSDADAGYIDINTILLEKSKLIPSLSLAGSNGLEHISDKRHQLEDNIIQVNCNSHNRSASPKKENGEISKCGESVEIVTNKNTGTIPKKLMSYVCKTPSIPNLCNTSHNDSSLVSNKFLQKSKQSEEIKNSKENILLNNNNLITNFNINKKNDSNISNDKSNSNDIILPSTSLTYKTFKNCNSSKNVISYSNEIISSYQDGDLSSLLNSQDKKHNIKNSINLLSTNCDEKILIDSLELIGLAPNKTIINTYFISKFENDTNFMEIPQFLIHISKQNCDYKNIINLIKSSCTNDKFKISFLPFDHFVEPKTEVIDVSIKEILKRWNPNTNLKKISKIKNRNFNSMNILGKVINILRQQSQKRELETFIGIPQYYPSGYINIVKLS